MLNKNNFIHIFIMLTTLFLAFSSGGCECGGSGEEEKSKDNIKYEDKFKSLSQYPAWTFEELKDRYKEASNHERLLNEIRQRRIVLEGAVERVGSSFLGFPYVRISYQGIGDFFKGEVNCYFSYDQDDLIQNIDLKGYLVVEGRINGSNELEDCKTIGYLGPNERSKIETVLEAGR